MAALEIDGMYWSLEALRARGQDVPRGRSVKELICEGEAAFDRLQALAIACADPRSGLPHLADAKSHLQLPILYPNKLIAVGANYSGHLAEMGLPIARWEPMPFFFKPPTTSMVGPGRTVVVPTDTSEFDWEIELAVVVGKRLSHASEAQARRAIAGYSVGLDLSARELIKPAGSAMPVDLARGKSQDTMSPMGPYIRPAAFVPDPHALRLSLRVNGVVRQDASTREMLYSIEEQLAIISRFVTLEPGDVVFTGSPAGSAKSHGVPFLQAGDEIAAEIEGVGLLEVTVKGREETLAA
ncbi:MAG TPA: fumarylacetoacetate hydrolase family protein [Ramlibacter sp.]|uniref:fumarylacetoacetate hydrolase family protein n=1 Tax=Ramlibacter sp. TaxID=1917967 RepID=UPI002BC10A29|nr:fumarylacetoacetate hydrolase family protein [Ramlibacter sp.]HVZ45733.1 fumarylacetoacetate hydrolase family protein [Ramlibacter sp.]